jgi:hypothetical protein
LICPLRHSYCLTDTVRCTVWGNSIIRLLGNSIKLVCLAKGWIEAAGFVA